MSFSGSERNRLFVSREAKRFDDLSSLAGLDDVADGRGFARFDVDRDGWVDFVQVNANAPLTELFRNQLGDDERLSKRSFVALRFIGGNSSSEPSDWSPRDGYGARITLVAGGRTYVTEHRCGEGFAAQNSATTLIGLGESERIDELTIRWPSGRVTQARDLPVKQLISCYERGPKHVVVAPYARQPLKPRAGGGRPAAGAELEIAALGEPAEGRWRLCVVTSTSCSACKRSIPHLRLLAERVGQLYELVGLPIDPADDAARLAAYQDEYKPPYRTAQLGEPDRAQLRQVLEQAGLAGATPVTLVLDDQGRLVRVFPGTPTVSDVISLRGE